MSSTDVLSSYHRSVTQHIYDSDRYPGVCQTYCRDMAYWFRSDPRRLFLLGDLGREMTVFTALARQAENGVTLASLSATVSAADMASAQRVRAICDRLQALGVVQVAGVSSDQRRRTLRFSGEWLSESLREWVEIYFRALTPWVEHLPECTLAAVVRLCRFTVDALEHRGLHPVLAWPEYRAVRDHLAGLPLLAELVGSVAATAPSPAPPISRKSLALAYGVSRIHVASLINGFVSSDWLFRSDVDGRLVFPFDSLARLRFQFARDLAWVALAFTDPPDDGAPIRTGPLPAWTDRGTLGFPTHVSS